MIRNLLIVTGIMTGLALAFYVYSVYFVTPISDSDLSIEELDSQIGREIISELEILKTLDITGNLFMDPVYMSLRDRTVEPVNEPVGRPNPFASIGSGVTSSVAPATSSSTRP